MFLAIVLSVIAATIPTVLYVLLVYLVDRYEKEPIWLLSAAFLWGAIPSILLALLFTSILNLPVYLLAGESVATAVSAIAIAPFIEEIVKGAMMVGIFVFWRHQIDSPLDGIIYGAMVGMGFGMVENVLYYIDAYLVSGLGGWSFNILMRGIVFGLNHALYTSATGLGIAIARLSPHRQTRRLAPLLGLAAAILLHAVHNFSTLLGGGLILLLFANAWGGVLITLFIIGWALTQEGQWIRDYLAEEVALGTVTAQQYANACMPGARFDKGVDALGHRGWRSYLLTSRFYLTCSKLAYKKHHHAQFNDADSAAAIIHLRQRVVRLGSQVSGEQLT